MKKQFAIRRDTSFNWNKHNPILSNREPAVESDTGIIKVGDGIAAWKDLPEITCRKFGMLLGNYTLVTNAYSSGPLTFSTETNTPRG